MFADSTKHFMQAKEFLQNKQLTHALDEAEFWLFEVSLVFTGYFNP